MPNLTTSGPNSGIPISIAGTVSMKHPRISSARLTRQSTAHLLSVKPPSWRASCSATWSEVMTNDITLPTPVRNMISVVVRADWLNASRNPAQLISRYSTARNSA